MKRVPAVTLQPDQRQRQSARPRQAEGSISDAQLKHASMMTRHEILSYDLPGNNSQVCFIVRTTSLPMESACVQALVVPLNAANDSRTEETKVPVSHCQ